MERTSRQEMERRGMNRLILIGNGFDLALGLKTGYSDFVIWLMKKYLAKAAGNRGVQSKIVDHANGYVKNPLFSVEWTNSYVFEKEEFGRITNINLLNQFISKYRIQFKNESKFYSRIISHFGQKGWVDIEKIFYEILLECLKPNNYTIENLNSDLYFLKSELEEYLIECTSSEIDWSELGLTMTSQFNAPFNPRLIQNPNKVNVSPKPDRICFLNFNYTASVSRFLKFFKGYTESFVEEIPIHGKLRDTENPIIFGFGDELDAYYEKLENRNDNKFFEHIKSFKYLQATNYHKLIRFIDSSNFEVFIYGHSCGLSDRTMLREIFEHENCKSIKIYFHQRTNGSNDFEEKTMEISRHFSNKGIMRRKIVDKKQCASIPQRSSSK